MATRIRFISWSLVACSYLAGFCLILLELTNAHAAGPGGAAESFSNYFTWNLLVTLILIPAVGWLMANKLKDLKDSVQSSHEILSENIKQIQRTLNEKIEGNYKASRDTFDLIQRQMDTMVPREIHDLTLENLRKDALLRAQQTDANVDQIKKCLHEIRDALRKEGVDRREKSSCDARPAP